MLKELLREIKLHASPVKAKSSAWFFKTGKGEYGEGDKFIGLTVPQMRILATKYQAINLSEVKKLLSSKIHELRFIALEILVIKFEKASDREKKKIVDFYLKNLKNINNWDLVDTSAPYILGRYLLMRKRKLLYRLAESNNLWERRIAIVSTFAFIKKGELNDTFQIIKKVLKDKHDLIHKAAGWMLREAGKKDETALRLFLDQYTRVMPRTMLRYSIERFPEKVRVKYLNSKHL